MLWKSKWRIKAEALENANAVLRDWLDSAIKDKDGYREREQRAVAALLAIQEKPALERPDASGAMEFLDKSFSLFNDTQGGEEVA